MKQSVLFFWRLSLILLLLIVWGFFVYWEDPLLQFRGKKRVDKQDAEFLNAGLIRNTDFNQVIIGSSMTECFIGSQFDSLFHGKTLKLSISGGSIYEHSLMLNYAFRHKKLKRVFWGLDLFSFDTDSLCKQHEFPEFLYEDALQNNLKYLYAVNNAITFIDRMFKEEVAIDSIYFWANGKRFKKSEVLRSYYKRDWKKRRSQETFERMVRNWKGHLQPLIQKYPETSFYFFFPPYSVLCYKGFEQQGVFDNYMRFKSFLAERLFVYRNVKVFDFQDCREITHNLDNYKDYSHYHPRINNWMVREMAENNFRLNERNTEFRIDSLINQVKNFKVEVAEK